MDQKMMHFCWYSEMNIMMQQLIRAMYENGKFKEVLKKNLIGKPSTEDTVAIKKFQNEFYKWIERWHKYLITSEDCLYSAAL